MSVPKYVETYSVLGENEERKETVLGVAGTSILAFEARHFDFFSVEIWRRDQVLQSDWVGTFEMCLPSVEVLHCSFRRFSSEFITKRGKTDSLPHLEGLFSDFCRFVADAAFKQVVSAPSVRLARSCTSLIWLVKARRCKSSPMRRTTKEVWRPSSRSPPCCAVVTWSVFVATRSARRLESSLSSPWKCACCPPACTCCPQKAP